MENSEKIYQETKMQRIKERKWKRGSLKKKENGDDNNNNNSKNT